MGLFGKSKEEHDNKQTSEIKQAATTDNSQNPPTPNFTAQVEEQNNNQNFVNPFAQQNSNTANINQSTPELSNSNQQEEFNPASDVSNNINQNQPSENSSAPAQTQNINPFENQNPTPDFQNQMQQNKQMNSGANNMQFPEEKKDSFSKDEIQEMIDETVEKIIEDKWDKLVTNIAKVVTWKEKQEAEVNGLKEDILTIKENVEKIEKKILSKINDYDRNILDVNSEIKALEKVFQKITPTLVNNVNELSKIADNLRGVKTENKKSDIENSDSNNRLSE